MRSRHHISARKGRDVGEYEKMIKHQIKLRGVGCGKILLRLYVGCGIL